MKKLLITFLMTATLALPAQACESAIEIKVNGLVCDFCARAVEKVMGDREEIAKVQVDLDMGMIRLNARDKVAISDATLTQLVTDAGYSVVKITRSKCS